MNTEEFNVAKRAVIEKCAKPMVDPAGNAIPKITMAEMSVLLAPDADHIPPSAMLYKIEKSALESLRRAMLNFGVKSFNDCFSNVAGRISAKQCNAAA